MYGYKCFVKNYMLFRNRSKCIQLFPKINYYIDFKRFSDLGYNANHTAFLYLVVLNIKAAS